MRYGSRTSTNASFRPIITINFGYIDKKLIRKEHRVFGFLLGSVTAGVAVWYYILKEYRVANEMLTDDIFVRIS